jgi:hypothetical protein
VLIFPWPATGRAVRINCFAAALGIAALLFVTLLTSPLQPKKKAGALSLRR